MKTRIIAGVALGILFVATSAFAQSTAQVQAELLALLQQLAALQAQLGSGAGGSVIGGGNTSVTTVQCPILTRVLKKGMSGSDVAGLQSFLGTDARIYPEATVSGYYGALTELAVKRFQARHGIIFSGDPESTGFGVVGPATRSVFARLCSLAHQPPQLPTVPTPPLVPTLSPCAVAGTIVPSGNSLKMYSRPEVPLGASCDVYSRMRQCINGQLLGDQVYQYIGCGSGAPVSTPGASCTVDGLTVSHGSSRVFYRQKNMPYGIQCQGEYRACSNGILGSPSDFPYSSCSTPNEPSSCTLDNVTISHGSSKTFYKQDSVLVGQQCSTFATTRTCTNGVLNGEDVFRFASCAAENAKTCSVVASAATTTVLSHLQDKSFFTVASVAWNQSCDAFRQLRTCNDGVMTGTAAYKFPTCTVTTPLNCTLDHVTVNHGTSRTFYTARSVAATAACTSIDQVRTCTNGVLSGAATYGSAVCAKVGQRYCLLDGSFVAHGKTITAYSARSVTVGGSCSAISKVRKCTDGVLDGGTTHPYASCSAAQARSCTLDGKTISDSTSATFYSVTTAPAGQCDEHALIRSCTDGYLGGSADFKYQTCDED